MGAAENLARVDPLPRLTAWLSGHPAVVAALDGGAVGPRNEPPYPCLRVLDPAGGDYRNLQWLVSVDIQLEAYGDLGGHPGKSALRRLLNTALGALAELPDAAAPPAGPVITAIASVPGGGWLPEPGTGQPRYIATVRVHLHP